MIALDRFPTRRRSGPPGSVAPQADGDNLIDALRRYARDRGPADADRCDPELSLMELQKLATLGRIATDVARDFGDLITVMLGYSDLMLTAAQHGETLGPEYLTELRRAAERASTLTSRLIGYSRPSADELNPLDLSHLVRGMSAVLGRLVGSVGRLVLTTDPAAGAVMADARQVEQAVINLVLNARDAIRADGRVEVLVEPVRLVEPLAYEDPLQDGPGVVPAGDYVRLRVRDDGCGMDPVTVGSLFRPFFTTKADGAGLGLTIVGRVAYKAGAAVVVDSARGAGTTVDLYFPRIEA